MLTLTLTRICRSLAFLARPKADISARTFGKMEAVAVRHVPAEERMQLTFKYGPQGGKARVYNMDRLQTEEVGKTLSRLSANVSKFVNRKKKKKVKLETGSAEAPEPEDLTVKLILGNTTVDENLPNSDAWVEGAVLQLGETSFSVTVNPPSIKALILPHNHMAGFPLYPKMDAEFIDLDKCDFTWFTNDATGAECTENSSGKAKSDETDNQSRIPHLEQQGSSVNVATSKAKGADSQSSETSRVELYRGRCYTPSNSDIGSTIKLVCTPYDHLGRKGNEIEATNGALVNAGPGICPFENRHIYTTKCADPGSFRVVTYNILADLYADSDYSRTVLYPYCPPYALHIDYRKQLVIKEVVGYNADIVCLQEVDRRVFMHDLLPTLDTEGFEGVQKLKTGQVPEGCATFYRRSKFRLIEQHDLNINDALSTLPQNKGLYDKVSSNEKVKQKMAERSTVLQVCVLESTEVPGKKIIIATTHLFFHPRAANIRLIQSAVCLTHITDLLQQYKTQDGTPAVIFCGDFNSSGKDSGVYGLMTDKFIPANHSAWYAAGGEEFIPDMELRHNLQLSSACGLPNYTNYVAGFNGCLDYIFIDKTQLCTTQVIPLPTHEEVTQYTALPNPVFPSDHLALVCDLTWTDLKNTANS